MTDEDIRAAGIRNPGNPHAYAVGEADWFVHLTPATMMRTLRWAEVAGMPAERAQWLRNRVVRLVDGRTARKASLTAPSEGLVVDIEGVRLTFAIDRRVSSEFFLRVLKRDPAGRYLIHEPAMQRALKRALHPGALLVDIGAHVGYFSCYGAALGAAVIAVEMQSTLCNAIRVNAALNDLWRVHTICAAMGDEPAMAQLPRTDPRPGTQVMSERSVSSWCSLETLNHDLVPILTVDQLLSMPEAASVRDTVVKVDVEGAEGLVLSGARRTIDARAAQFIVEIHPQSMTAFSHRAEDVIDAFPAARWRSFLLDDDEEREIEGPDLLDRIAQSGEISGVTNVTVRFAPR